MNNSRLNFILGEVVHHVRCKIMSIAFVVSGKIAGTERK